MCNCHGKDDDIGKMMAIGFDHGDHINTATRMRVNSVQASNDWWPTRERLSAALIVQYTLEPGTMFEGKPGTMNRPHKC